MSKNIAIIPARKGSKRIKNKNIKLFNGHPMISWPIKIAIESGIFDQVIVSTDSKKIANIANSYGAITPFIRDKKLSDDFTPVKDVISDVINKFDKREKHFDYVCCIFPCTPFLSKNDLKSTLKKLKKTKSNFLVPIAEYSHPIQRALKITNKCNVIPENRKYLKSRTQDLSKFYYDTGSFYWGKSKSWKNKKNIFDNCTFVKIPNWRVFDIDNTDDWKRAEVFKKNLENK